MQDGEITFFMIVVGLPMLIGLYIFHRYFGMKQRKMEIEASQAAEKAAQYAVDNVQLEQRVRVLEQIVVDSGAQTAQQIEALRDIQSLPKGEKTG